MGVSNYDVHFRDAELAQIHNSDYRVRCHRSRGESGQGEAERTNSAIADALSMMRLWSGNASNDSTTFQRNKYRKYLYQNFKNTKENIWLKTISTFQNKLPSVSTMCSY